ncbi:DUF4440 domain-containing protein [bacterium BMS3Abin03]|jgi:ketosteroid isomerase-like protein|nr:DUF4440 domain-containing protein [bacterium BMS3Abin03]
MKKLFLTILTLLFCTIFLQAQDLSELKKKVQTLNDKYAKAMISGDMSSVWSGYAEDVISLPSYEPMIKGLDAIKKSSEDMEKSGVKFNSFSTTCTDVIKSGNLVIDIGTYKTSMQIPGMDMPWNDYGKYLTVWEIADDGTWKVKVETWNTDTNPWADTQAHDEPMKEGKTDDESKEAGEK